jgi:hypothetical protein
MTETAKKPGRPRKYGQGRINATVRFTPERYAALKKAADNRGRSVSEEVEARVEASGLEESLQGIRRGIEEIRADIQKLTAANLVTAPPVITAATLTLNEETVERAVARALAKAVRNQGED